MSQLVLKSSSKISDVKGVMIFGNHSLTQYPCINSIKIQGVPAKEKLQKEWLEQTFIKNVQNRGG